MPTYDFRCPAGHDFERFYRKISDAASEVACPECGQVAVRQVSGGAGLVFKGSGFYITDYGKDGKKDQRKSAPKEEASGASGASADSTSATSSEKATDTGKTAEKGSSPSKKPSSGSSGGE
ncbi:MAG: FmdB family zinc ribbon protein [Gemmatimonadaceae bacterium]